MRNIVISSAVFLPLSIAAADGHAAEAVQIAQAERPQTYQPSKLPCKCRALDGKKVRLGAKMCTRRGEGLVTLQCRLVLNNTSWQKIEDGCAVPDLV